MQTKRRIPKGSDFRNHTPYLILSYLAEHGGWLYTNQIKHWLLRKLDSGDYSHYIERLVSLVMVEWRWQRSKDGGRPFKQFKINDKGRAELNYYNDDYRRTCGCCGKKYHQGDSKFKFCANCLYAGCRVELPKCGRPSRPGDIKPKPTPEVRLLPGVGGVKIEEKRRKE